MSNAVATTQTSTNPLVALRHDLGRRADEFKAALPSHISFERFQRVMVTAVQNDPDLLTADRRSLINALMKCAQDGLLPDKREAAMVLFRRNFQDNGQWKHVMEVQYIPMVYGLKKKILQSGEVIDLQSGVVYAAEVRRGMFMYEIGVTPPLRHTPDLALTEEETQDDQIVGAYSIATLKDGTKSYEFMRRFEIDKVQNTSQTGAMRDKKGKPRTPTGPWKDWYPEQCKKTVVRRHSKSLPMSTDLAPAYATLDHEEREELRIGQMGMMDQQLSADEAAPVLTDGRGDQGGADNTPHDPQTGEILDNQGGAQTGDQSDDSADDAQGAVEQKVTIEEATSIIAECKTVTQVNTSISSFMDRMSEDDFDKIREVGIDRIAELKASADDAAKAGGQ